MKTHYSSNALGRLARTPLLTLLTAVGLAHRAAAQPANDNFADALPIVGFFNEVGVSSVDATKESGEPAHPDNAGGASVWFRWTPPFAAYVQMDTLDSDFDTLLAVYTGDTIDALSLVAANDDAVSDDIRSFVQFYATPDQTYYIAVDGYDGETGHVFLSWQLSLPPVNDDFANATELIVRFGTIRNTSSAASKALDEPALAGNEGGRSVWFKWTAPADGPATFTTTGSGFDTLLGVYTGESLDALTLVAENDDNGTTTRSSEVVFDAEVGVTYHIVVDGYRGTALVADSGLYRLSWGLGVPENDNFASAQALGGSEGTYEDRNLLATKEAAEPNHGGAPGQRSVWYSWVAPKDGLYTFNTFGSHFDTTLAVYTGDEVNNLFGVADSDDANDLTRTSRVEFTATEGTIYYIAVDGYRGGGLTARGHLRLNWGTGSPANDLQENAAPIAGDTGSVTGANFFASLEFDEPFHAGLDGGRSIWYAWTPDNRGVVTVSTVGTTFDTLLGVYYVGEGGDLLPIKDNNNIDATADFNQSRVQFEVEVGATYLIAVDGYAATEGLVTLSWTTEPPPILNITRDGSDVIINWTGPSYHLQTTPALGEPTQWNNLPGASPVRVPAGDGNQLFRTIWP